MTDQTYPREYVGWKQRDEPAPPRGIEVWTVYTKWPQDGRGEYSEEIDVQARTRASAKRFAQSLLDDPTRYQPGGRAVRVVGPRVGFYM